MLPLCTILVLLDGFCWDGNKIDRRKIVKDSETETRIKRQTETGRDRDRDRQRETEGGRGI